MTKKVVEFLTELSLVVLNDSSFRLKEDFYVNVKCNELVIPEGFETDLASVPRLPIVYLTMGSTGHKAAVLHDWLYATNMFPREECDSIFYEALLECGLNKIHAYTMFLGVRAGGGAPYALYATKLKEQKEKQNGTSTS